MRNQIAHHHHYLRIRGKHMSRCGHCRHEFLPHQTVCRCGWDRQKLTHVRPTTNETYVADQSFGRKKWESLVLHSMSYVLRNVHISFQHPVYSHRTDRRYLLDAYFPDLNLAVEVDEEHHARQAAADIAREQDIQEILGCEIERIDAYGAPLFPQIDRLVEKIGRLTHERGIQPYLRPAPEERFESGPAGAYAAAMVDELERSGAFSFMEDFSRDVCELGYDVKFSSIDGIPSTANGEAGFVLTLDQVFRFTLHRRKTPGLRLLIADAKTANFMNEIGFPTRGHQPKGDDAENPRFRYYSLPDEGHRLDSGAMIQLLRAIKQRFDQANLLRA